MNVREIIDHRFNKRLGNSGYNLPRYETVKEKTLGEYVVTTSVLRMAVNQVSQLTDSDEAREALQAVLEVATRFETYR